MRVSRMSVRVRTCELVCMCVLGRDGGMCVRGVRVCKHFDSRERVNVIFCPELM